MTPKAKELHQKIADNLYEIMDNIDTAIYKMQHLQKMGHNHGKHIVKLSQLKETTKTMLNQDFDKLALQRKEPKSNF